MLRKVSDDATKEGYILIKYIVQGGTKLSGSVTISGAKNAAVAILPATLLVSGPCRIENVPDISDVRLLLEILRDMGAEIHRYGRNTLEIDCSRARNATAPIELVRRIRASSGAHETILSDTEQAGAYFLDLFLGEREEKLYEACLDAKGRLLACHLVAEGDTDSVQLNMRKIVENALKCGASSVLLAHNHPSGVALPSPADNATTLSGFDALRTVGVELADHIIVADDDFVSLRHNGLLPERKGNGYGI